MEGGGEWAAVPGGSLPTPTGWRGASKPIIEDGRIIRNSDAVKSSSGEHGPCRGSLWRPQAGCHHLILLDSVIRLKKTQTTGTFISKG